jgi:hypothetical protein
MNNEEIIKIKRNSSDFLEKQNFKQSLNYYNKLVDNYLSKTEGENYNEVCKALLRQAIVIFTLMIMKNHLIY